MRKHIFSALLCSCFALPLSAQAQQLVYTPTNPAFGGNPANTTHLFASANAQKSATAGDEYDGYIPGLDGDSGDDAAELFVRYLQNRLISDLATQVANAIYPDEGQGAAGGTIVFGDQEVTFSNDGTTLKLDILDSVGGVTSIEIPLFQSN